MAELEALIFDVDGTLADTERDGHRPAFNRAFSDAGLDWDWSPETYGELLTVTGGKERMRFHMERENIELDVDGDVADYIAGLHAAKTEHYKAMMADGVVPLRPGVERLLNEARERGFRLAIATTTTPENVTALVTNTLGAEAMDWFEVIGAGDLVPAKKPAPDIYTWVLEKMGLKGDQVIAFEDSGHGVTSAADAGIDSILVTTNGYTVEQDFSRASVVLDQLGEADDSASKQADKGPDPAGFVDVDYLISLHQG